MNKNLILPIILMLLIRGCSYLPEPGMDLPDVLNRETRDYIDILPSQANISSTGFIIYPGGLVDPHAYVELASRFALSGSGHHVIIAKMPANLAVMRTHAALKITEEFPGERWVIGGHSLGGTMACSLLEKEANRFEGLVLMAAYSSGSIDLSHWEGAVLSITAGNDRILDWEKFEEGIIRLPPHALFYKIDGGNHGGFGSYGQQKGDGEAEISREAQHQQIVEQLQNFYLENGFE